MLALSNHLKFREEKDSIFLVDCKRLRDFKLGKEFLPVLNKFKSGFYPSDIKSVEEKSLFRDIKKIRGFVSFSIKPLVSAEYKSVYLFIQKTLFSNKEILQPRTYRFLLSKLKKHNSFFLGAYIGKTLVGIIQGFPREDYLLLSELAVVKEFRGRNFGRLLVQAFEKQAVKKDFKKIKLGAQDESIDFYKKQGYAPSILIQTRKKNSKTRLGQLLKKYKPISIKENKDIMIIELECPKKNTPLEVLDKLKKEFNAFSTQYLFTKKVKLPTGSY